MKRPRFAPPPPAPSPPQEPQLQLYDKPEDQILLHGEMIRDAGTITEILQGLPFAGVDYRGNLRVIISANLRIRDVCLALLGEREPEASNKIDAGEPHEIEQASGPTGSERDGAPRSTGKRSQGARLEPGNGRGRPSLNKPRASRSVTDSPAVEPEPVGRKLQILQILRKRAMTSAQLIDQFKDTASAASIYSVLTVMRNENLIDTRNDPTDGERKNFVK